MTRRPGLDGQQAPLPDASRLPGRQALLIGALTVGLLMLGIQLWLLSVALEMYLSGDGETVWGIALVSGFVFAGGLLAVWLLSRRPVIRRPGRR